MTICEAKPVIRYFFSVVVVALAVQTNPAFAQKADLPAVKVGDRWTFKVSEAGAKADRHWVVTSVTPDRIEGTENAKPLALTPELNEIESPRGKDSNRKLLSFPLEVGKKWDFADEYVLLGNKRSTRANVTVTGYGKIRVPAGEFDAFKLEAKSVWMNRKENVAGDYSARYWYAPVARAIVKFASESNLPIRPPVSYELIKLELRP